MASISDSTTQFAVDKGSVFRYSSFVFGACPSVGGVTLLVRHSAFLLFDSARHASFKRACLRLQLSIAVTYARRIVTPVAAVVSAVIISGCSHFEALPNSEIHVIDRGLELAVPFEPQLEASLCGFGAVKMLTRYHGVEMTSAQRVSLLYEASRTGGVSGRNLSAVLRAAGYSVFIFRGTLDDQPTGLYRHLKHGRPLLVMMGPEDGTDVYHYDLLVGYDPSGDEVILLDPSVGRLTLPTASFEASWKSANYFTLLAVPLGESNK